MRSDVGPDLLDVIFDLAGGPGGPGARMRIWSVLALAGAVMLGFWGGYSYLRSVTTEVTAAQIEGGYDPPVRSFWRRSYRQPNPYHITERLADIDGVAFNRNRERWRCAPIVSDTDGAPRVFYAASETHYLQARAANRLVGELYQAPRSPVWKGVEGTVPYDAYLLFDDGTQPRELASARSLLIISAVIGSIALVAFVMALRKQQKAQAA